MAIIEPRTLKGFRDFLPSSAAVRQRIVATITKTYESFGYLPLETPALEYADVLTGKYGDEGEKLMYRFRDQGGRDVALRYDLTVPLARVIAQYPELPKPFRRYQIAPVWRAENTQKGRFREFTQCDFDIVGASSIVADAEVVQVIAAALTNLGIAKFEVRFNSRKVLNGLLDRAGISQEQWLPSLRALDKWQKIGVDGVREQLSSFLPKEQTDAIMKLLPKEGEAFFTWSKRVSSEMIKSPVGKDGWREVNRLYELLQSTADNPKTFVVDPLLARGLDYYTGTIIEAVLTEKPEFGSVFGGGRYDTLIGQFIGKDLPAVGASAGLDRLVAALEELRALPESRTSTKVLVTLMDESLTDETVKLANALRSNGVAVEIYPEPTRLDKQLKYADKLNIPVAIMYGSQEQEEGMVTVKELATKGQKKVPREQLPETIQRIVLR